MRLEDIERIANNSSVMVVVLDENLKYVYVNDAHAKVSGLTREMAIGHSNEELFGKEPSREWDENDKKALASSGYKIEPNEWIDREGKLRKFLGTRMRIILNGKPHSIAMVSEIKEDEPSEFEHAQADLNGIIMMVEVLRENIQGTL